MEILCPLQHLSDADLEELAAEARLLKKFKAGKVWFELAYFQNQCSL